MAGVGRFRRVTRADPGRVETDIRVRMMSQTTSFSGEMGKRRVVQLAHILFTEPENDMSFLMGKRHVVQEIADIKKKKKTIFQGPWKGVPCSNFSKFGYFAPFSILQLF